MTPAGSSTVDNEAVDACIRRIINCPVAPTLRARRRRLTDIILAPRFSPRARKLRSARQAVEAFLAQSGPSLCVIGPRVDESVRAWFSEDHTDHLLDLSGLGLGMPGQDPRRRSLKETWYTTAKAGAELALEVMQTAAPSPWNDLIAAHRNALMLRLKPELALRLRRLEIADNSARTTAARVVHLVEGDDPLDDLEAHFHATGLTVTHHLGPTWKTGAARYIARRHDPGEVHAEAAWAAFAAVVEKWKPGQLNVGRKAVIVGDLRRKVEFRHSQTVRALLAAAAADANGSVLVQPFTRRTSNVARATGAAVALGSRAVLVRQPQSSQPRTSLAGVRTLLLNRINQALGPEFTTGQRAAILEGCGAFVASSLAPSLALASELSRQFARQPPRFVASVPLGSPFGGIVVSAARAAGVPTVELQTLMIGTSDRDPMPVAERVGVLDDSQRDIFKMRFGVLPEQFIFAGHVDIGQADDRDPRVAASRSIIFASQPLDDVSCAALDIVAAACDALGDVSLSVSPHPDETVADIARSRAILERWPRLRGKILPAGGTHSALLDHAVLCTVVSNVAIRAAQHGMPVLMVNPGVDMPVDFARLGIALTAETAEAAQTILDDFFAHGPRVQRLEATRAAYFQQNPQLLDCGAADRIIAAMAPEDPYWRRKAPGQIQRSQARLQLGVSA